MSRPWLPLLALLIACGPEADDSGDTDTPSPLLDVKQTDTWTIPGLKAEGHVVYTEMGVPHVYAASKADLGRIVGFTLARDRFFYMDLASRLALGSISGIFGDAALETDVENRQYGTTFITDRVLGLLDEDPETAAYFDGIAEGVNAYIAQVEAGKLQPPSEYELAAGLLGASAAIDLMESWDRRRVVGGVVTVLYESGFETKDVGRSRDAQRLATVFEGAPLELLRTEGLYEDSWGRVEPVKAIAQAPEWLDAQGTSGTHRRAVRVPVESQALERLYESTQRMEQRLGHEWISGFGSNAWVVSAEASADGRAMVATDGHLPLSIPPLFYQIGLDTQHLGGGDISQVGLMTPAMPLLGIGTNGKVAFGQTQLIGDITDWYSETLTLDANGAPATSLFQGDDKPLVAVSETVDVAPVGGLLGGGFSGPFTFTRYTTFDGRWITSIEGHEVSGPDDVGEGETAVHLFGKWIVPADVDGVGGITAISFDYAGLDLSNMPQVIDRYAKADDLDAFAEATHDLVAYSLNLVAADASGDILYSGFQATPCRDYLAREPDGAWSEGADPNLMLDGSTYGGFTIPIQDGRVDFDQTDPYKCVISPDDYPHARNPEQGFLVSGNNDPGGFSFDGSLTDDPVYIGGPWMEGYRPAEIADRLQDAIDAGGVSLDDMKTIQANHTSVLGEQLAPVLLEAIAQARVYSQARGELEGSEARTLALFEGRQTDIEDVETRMEAWIARGTQAESGVDTFYETPTADEKADAVATMIFNAWMGRYVGYAVNDEGIPGLGFPTGDSGRFRLLTRMLQGRGPDNPLGMGSYNEDTEESAFFDIKSTEPIETSTEIAILALVEALDYLAEPPSDPGVGGFGTTDKSKWLWGLRHTVSMTSLLGDFFGFDDPLLGPIIAPFNITPATFPVADGLTSDDPRYNLPGFPRHADNLCVDAANSGTDGRTFDNSYGSVWRMVVALGGKGFEMYNVLPGGQSGLTDSPNFADQAKLWLGNDYLPVWLDVNDVAAHGLRRETFKAP